jgi:hypothetical protein
MIKLVLLRWNSLANFLTTLFWLESSFCIYSWFLSLFHVMKECTAGGSNGWRFFEKSSSKNIREYITKQSFLTLGNNIHDIKVVDIACGCGGFLNKFLTVVMDFSLKNADTSNLLIGFTSVEYSFKQSNTNLFTQGFKLGSFCSIFSFLCSVLEIVACPFSFVHCN